MFDLIAELRQHNHSILNALRDGDVIDAAYHSGEINRLLDRLAVAA